MCDRGYTFDCDAIRQRKGLAWYPVVTPAAGSNGCRILATGRPALTCAALGPMQNSASCAEIPSTNRQFETLIGLPGYRVPLSAVKFGKTSSRETRHFPSEWSSACVPSLEPPLAWIRSASDSSRCSGGAGGGTEDEGAGSRDGICVTGIRQRRTQGQRNSGKT